MCTPLYEPYNIYDTTHIYLYDTHKFMTTHITFDINFFFQNFFLKKKKYSHSLKNLFEQEHAFNSRTLT